MTDTLLSELQVIKAHRSYCTKELDDEFFGFYNRELSGQTEQKPEEKRSIGAVNAFAGEMMGKVFVAKMFPPECKQEMAGMIDETLQVGGVWLKLCPTFVKHLTHAHPS